MYFYSDSNHGLENLFFQGSLEGEARGPLRSRSRVTLYKLSGSNKMVEASVISTP